MDIIAWLGQALPENLTSAEQVLIGFIPVFVGAVMLLIVFSRFALGRSGEEDSEAVKTKTLSPIDVEIESIKPDQKTKLSLFGISLKKG